MPYAEQYQTVTIICRRFDMKKEHHTPIEKKTVDEEKVVKLIVNA